MLIKRGDAEILDVIKDDEHEIDDDGTRKAVAAAVQKIKKGQDEQQKNLEKN